MSASIIQSVLFVPVSQCVCNERYVLCTLCRIRRRETKGGGSGLSNGHRRELAEAQRSMQVVWIEEKEEVGLGRRRDRAADAAEVGHVIQCHAWAHARQDTGARDHLSH